MRKSYEPFGRRRIKCAGDRVNGLPPGQDVQWKIDQEVSGRLVLKMTESYDIVGQSVSRVDGLGKLTGDALYAGDISFPGCFTSKS